MSNCISTLALISAFSEPSFESIKLNADFKFTSLPAAPSPTAKSSSLVLSFSDKDNLF